MLSEVLKLAKENFGPSIKKVLDTAKARKGRTMPFSDEEKSKLRELLKKDWIELESDRMEIEYDKSGMPTKIKFGLANQHNLKESEEYVEKELTASEKSVDWKDLQKQQKEGAKLWIKLKVEVLGFRIGSNSSAGGID